MNPSPAQTLEQFKESSQAFREEMKNDPQKARDFLIRAGIARQCDTGTGIELVPQLRPAK